MPVHRYTDSYPHQRCQTGYQTFPTYVPIEPLKSAMVYESWPTGGGYGYQMPSHSCCNHENFPGFHGFRPSYPQPMPSPVHCCGGYPAPFHEACPVYYVPSPHYSAELPRYEFDKNMPGRYYCWGCSNHPSHQRGDSDLRIEEEKPNVVEKKGNESLLPVEMKNYPYPVMWIPPEYVKEQRRLSEPKVEELESFPRKTNGAETKESHGQPPMIWNGWLPPDPDKMKYLTNRGDGKRNRDQNNEEQKKDFQFPVIWMPSYDGRSEESGKKENKDVNCGHCQDQKREDQMRQFPFPIVWLPPQGRKQEEGKGKDGKQVYASSNFAENPPYIFKFVPMRHLEGNNMENCKVNEENHASNSDTVVKEKTSSQKSIPVKHVDSREEEKSEETEKDRAIPVKQVEETVKSKPSGQKNIPVKHVDSRKEETSEETEKKDRAIPVKQVEETVKSKPSEDNDRKQSSLSPRSSKLAPVCLRVDPLPKKKNGTSRSPSPKKNGSSRSPSPPGLKEHSEQRLDDTMKASVQSEKNTKQASVESILANNREGETKKKQAKEIASVGNKVSAHSARHTSAEVCEKSTTQERADPKEATDLGVAGDKRKLEKKTLLNVEAALLIQAAYRGYEVRRLEPIKKLKQIADVREEVADVQNRIQDLESSSDTRGDDKQKLLIGETIMRLLLKLDAIQGLHPSLRDIRKSLAKELVTLQEKLDTIAINKAEEPKVGVCPIDSVEPVETKINECKLKQEKTGGFERLDMIHSVGDKLLPPMDSVDESKGEESLLSSSDNKAQNIVSEGSGQELLVASDLKPKELDFEAIVEHNNEVGSRETEAEACAKELMETEEVNNAPDYKQAVEVPEKEYENYYDTLADSFVTINGTCADDITETILDELPVSVIEEEHVESEKDEQAEMEKTMTYGTVSSEATSPGDNEGLMSLQEVEEMNGLAKLPVGAIDGDYEASAKVEKHRDLLGRESELQSTTETSLPEDKSPNENEKSEEVLEEKPKMETGESVQIGCEESQKLPVTFVPEEHNECSLLSEPVISTANVLSAVERISADMTTGKEVPNEEKHLPLLTTEEVKETQEMEVQAKNQIEFSSGKKMDSKWDGLDFTTNSEEVSEGIEFTPLRPQAEHEGESLLASTTSIKMSTDECEMGSKTDKRLVEENEKMREMMEKLIEAGKRQLNVISNLNGRVKDLEKKLSRRKKLGTKRIKSAACGASRLKRSNVHVRKERAAGIAM